jgi:cell division septum initiation protein DivIVA
MRTYRSRDVKFDFLDDARTRLQNTQDELTVAQNYVHHLEVELHERNKQLAVSQAQTVELQDAVEHLQEFLWMRSPRRTLRRMRARPEWRTTRLFLYVPRGLRSVVAFGFLALY